MPARFTLRQLEYFVAVAECGSVTGAADRVNVSSPSISSAIAQLEASFGLSLFVRRHAKGLSLTRHGTQFFEQARAVLAQAGRLNDLANSVAQRVQGPLHVGCFLTFAQVILPQLRRSFSDAYPDVELHQVEQNQSDLFDGLRNAQLDVAIGYDMDMPRDLEFVPLASLTPYAILPVDHPLAARKSLRPEDLAPFPMVLLDLPISTRYFLSIFADRGLKPKIAERSRDMGVMQSLVGQGFGYSVANIRPWSNRSPDGRRLCYVPLVPGVRPLTVGLFLAEGARASLTVSTFVDHCLANLTPGKVAALRQGLDGIPD